MNQLTRDDLVQLLNAVFPRLEQDKNLAILVDVPNTPESDTENWQTRRRIAGEWFQELKDDLNALNLEKLHLVAYASVDSNNADLPTTGCIIDGAVPDLSSDLKGESIDFEDLFSTHQLFMAPTQFSTTAPLKVAAKKFGFRAATMPGFSPKMIPALQIDYGIVNQRCQLVKGLLDKAEAVKVKFLVDGTDEYDVYFDTRFRPAHASGGRFPDSSTAGNLPSGETYIVPYEGEKGEISKTNGTLPVQLGDEVVLFNIEANNAVSVLSSGAASDEHAAWLKREPAYGNMAELGFGILADFGLQPIDEILLDEKLAFHVAFGRSDHFGGDTGPDKFSSPSAVVHIDRIYSPMMQPRISVLSIDLIAKNKENNRILQNDKYLIFS